MNSSSIGVGAAGGHLGVGVGGTVSTGSQQSLLAQELAPPKKKAIGFGGCLGCCLLMFGIVCMFAGSGSDVIFVGTALTGIGILFYWKAHRLSEQFNETEYPKLLAAWERSFLCMRCGHRFEASE
jgi:hypothetical protein